RPGTGSRPVCCGSRCARDFVLMGTDSPPVDVCKMTFARDGAAWSANYEANHEDTKSSDPPTGACPGDLGVERVQPDGDAHGIDRRPPGGIPTGRRRVLSAPVPAGAAAARLSDEPYL